ncbi:MAG: tyrosine-type recombinase/integrase [Desulfosalsimonadaceae bacterium]
MKFTKRFLDTVEPPETGKIYLYDETQPGLGIMIFPSGTISFIYQYRIKGKKKRLTIGKYGKITLKDAQDKAINLASQVLNGVDPSAEKHREETEGLTLDMAFNEYLHARDLKPRTVADIKRAMKGFDDWMHRPILSITREMVAIRHKKLGEKSHARANLAMRYLRAILNHASQAHASEDGVGLLPGNPVARLSATKEWFKIQRKHSYLQEHEIKAWFEAVLDLPNLPALPGKRNTILRHGDIARDFYLLLLLTGLRRSEAMGLRWCDIDFEARTLTILDLKTKNNETHVLPLSDYLFDLLSERKRKSKGPLVLSGKDGKGFQTIKEAENRILGATGIKFCCHDLRRTFATAAESLNISSYAVKTLLNHKQSGDVTRGYIQITPDRLRVPMQQITNYFLQKAGIKGLRVVELPTAIREAK